MNTNEHEYARSRGAGSKHSCPFVFVRGFLLLWSAATALANGSIEGTVIGADGMPVAGVQVQLIHAASKQTAAAVSDRDGRYVARDLLRGKWFVQAAGASQRFLGRRGIEVADDQVTRDIDLRAGNLTVNGLVRDANDAPMAGAFVTAKRLDFGPDEFLPTAAAISASTADDGAYALPELSAGTYSVTVAGPGRGMVMVTNFALSADAALDFTFVDSCRITGTVTDEHGEPLQDVGIQAFRTEPSPVIRSYAMTDDEGVYTVLNAGPGVYELVAMAPERVAVSLPGVPVEDGTTSAGNNLTVRPGPGGRITGVVTYGDQPIPVVVMARSATERLELMTRSDEKGEYLFDRLADGDYLVSFSDPTADDVRVTVKDAGTVTLDYSYYGE
jgi:protocatechuate 3,4-dioxygenase beta subunit